MKTSHLLKTSSILWVVWGLVHAFAGIMTISGDTTTAIQGIADGIDPATLTMAYPDAVGGLINQHGWNLLWIGVFTLVSGIFIWKENVTAVMFTALVGGLTDLGYFIFMDLGGYVNFVPGTLMTLVSSAAILISLYAFWIRK